MKTKQLTLCSVVMLVIILLPITIYAGECLLVTDEVKQAVTATENRAGYEVLNVRPKSFCYSANTAVIEAIIKNRQTERVLKSYSVFLFKKNRFKLVNAGGANYLSKKYPNLEEKMWLAGYTP